MALGHQCNMMYDYYYARLTIIVSIQECVILQFHECYVLLEVCADD
jgi:hypothetical protein